MPTAAEKITLTSPSWLDVPGFIRTVPRLPPRDPPIEAAARRFYVRIMGCEDDDKGGSILDTVCDVRRFRGTPSKRKVPQDKANILYCYTTVWPDLPAWALKRLLAGEYRVEGTAAVVER